MSATTIRLAACVAALVVWSPAPAAAEPRGFFALPLHVDARDAGTAALDLREVGFDQRRTRIWLKVRTWRPWADRSLATDALCLDMARAGRLCATHNGVRVRLRFTARGGGVARDLRATVRRPDGRTLVARLHPRELGLRDGTYRWVARAGTADRVPDRGRGRARVGGFGAPACFGAEARARRCANPALRRTVVPTPGAAALNRDAGCRPAPTSALGVAVPCHFGSLESRTPRLALIGDSHSAHWRAAVEVALQARGWRGVSLTRAGCTFSSEAYPAPAPIPARCRRHTSEAIEWLKAHPEVHTVVTSSSAGRGLSAAGFLAIWNQVPDSVRRIYVIRDTPRMPPSAIDCVRSRLARRRPLVRACAFPRARAFPPDASASAAARAGGRVRLLDFTRYFCGSARCFPVIGGAYVYRDLNHMNSIFNATLGPYVLKALA